MNDSELIYSHDCMITDRWRNRFLHTAITRHARDRVVLDVGSGTGLLSCYALEAGASFVYAVESDETAASVTQQVLSANFAQDRFRVLHINFWSDQLLSVEFHSKIDMLVSETVGPGLFDQGWFLTMHSAGPLLSSDAVTIPDRLGVDLWLYRPDRLLDSRVNRMVSRRSNMLSDRFSDTIQSLMSQQSQRVTNTHWIINEVPEPPQHRIENVLQLGVHNMPEIKLSGNPFPSHLLPMISFDAQIDQPCTAAMINKISFEGDTLYCKDAETMPWRWQPVCAIDQPGRYRFTYNNPMLDYMPRDEWQSHKID